MTASIAPVYAFGHNATTVNLVRHTARVSCAAVFAITAMVGQHHAVGMVAETAPREWTYRVVNVYPHDSEAYTQGLIYRDGFLFESTGLKGRSTLRKVRLETGEVVQQVYVDPAYFAEGLTDWHEQLVQLTWTSHAGFVYDLSTFTLK